ncbi:MAG TPA: hypothetical protein VGF82_06100 [Terracidiphilus sp.]
MSAEKNVFDEHEDRVMMITAIAIDANALNPGEAGGSPSSTGNLGSEKFVYAKAFQAWADDRLSGTAEDIFETVQEVLEC